MCSISTVTSESMGLRMNSGEELKYLSSEYIGESYPGRILSRVGSKIVAEEVGLSMDVNLTEALATPPGSVESMSGCVSEEEPEFDTNIGNLFPEILMEIFLKLSVRDLGNVARTCRTWNAILNENKRLWRDVQAKIHLKKSGNQVVYQCLHRRGIRDVQVLSLKRSLRELTSSLPNISRLKLSGCYNVTDWTLSSGFSMKLENLTHLNLSLCKQVSDFSIGRIASMAVNLQKLELGGCCQITNRGLLLISWGLKKLRKLNLRSCYLITDTGIGFLAGVVHPSHLQEPRMNDFLVKFGLLDSPQPVEGAAVMSGSNGVSMRRSEEAQLMFLRNNMQGMSGGNGGNGPPPLSRSTSQPHHPPTVPVRKFRVDSNGNPVSMGPQQCAICKQDIPVYDSSSGYGGGGAGVMPRKRPRLSMTNGPTASTSSSASASYLSMMMMAGQAVYEAGSGGSSGGNKSGSVSGNNQAVLLEKIGAKTEFGNKCLEELALQDCQKLSDDCLNHLTHLKRLKTINLSFCVHITDSGLRHLGACDALKEINLRACDNVTDIGLANLAYELASRITSLDVSFCDKIRNSGLNHLSLFSKLKELSMSACDISDDGLIRIANSLKSLETLNIGQCGSVTDKSLKVIAEKCRELKYIDLYGCGKISPAGIALLMKLPLLENLNLGLWNLR